MSISIVKEVNEFLLDIERISSNQFNTVIAIRKLFFTAKSDLAEGIKYGGIAFSISNDLIGGIYIYKKHISIEFSRGADFNDKHGKLEGKGKKRRHLKILPCDDVNIELIDFYIKQAVTDLNASN